MTTAELEAEADRIAAARADSRTPRVVRRALLSGDGLTLRQYLQLEEAGSPLLHGGLAADDTRARAEAIYTAWLIVFPDRPIPAVDALPEARATLQAAIGRAFSTAMPMRWPLPGPTSAPRADGLGWVVCLIGRFVALGWLLDEILDSHLDALFLMQAGVLADEGYDCAGEDYRDRESGFTGFVHHNEEGNQTQGEPEYEKKPDHDEL